MMANCRLLGTLLLMRSRYSIDLSELRSRTATATGYLLLIANWYAQLLAFCEQALPLVSTVWAVIFPEVVEEDVPGLLLAAMLWRCSWWLLQFSSAGRRKT